MQKIKAANTGLAKVVVSFSAEYLWLMKWFSASTFLLKIATVAKPPTVSGNAKTSAQNELTDEQEHF